jgi:molybdate transport system substrate-binding protein
LRPRRLTFLVLTLLPFVGALAQGQEVRVAAASDLKFAMEDLAAQFEKQTGTAVRAAYGSSGNFYSQLESGAPFDLFFSADAGYPKRLEDAGLAEPGTLYTYAVGRIVIWMPKDAGTDLARRGWDALLDVNTRKISIANPEHAPYGRAAVTALRNAGIYDRVKTKLVFGEDISQAAQFVQSGNAQAGIVAMSIALSPAMKGGRIWEIPLSLYPPIEQAVIMLKNANNKSGAKLFLDFVKSPGGREILLRDGFRPQGAGIVGAVTQ